MQRKKVSISVSDDQYRMFLLMSPELDKADIGLEEIVAIYEMIMDYFEFDFEIVDMDIIFNATKDLRTCAINGFKQYMINGIIKLNKKLRDDRCVALIDIIVDYSDLKCFVLHLKARREFCEFYL